MNMFRSFVRQLSTIWENAGAAQRAALVAAGILLMAAVIGVGIWSARPQYVNLASGLTPTEAADLVARLEQQNISYRMTFSGSGIQVPKKMYNSARIAAAELVMPAKGLGGGIETSLLDDPGMNEYRIERQLEDNLARTIQQFESVSEATVHIGKPPQSPFVSQQQEVTASVVLKLTPRAAFTARQGTAVVATVAKAVEGLKPENVTVMDTQGRILSSDHNGGADIAGQLEYQKRVETDLASNAELMLSQLLGFGRAVVRVSADIDFTRKTTTETVYDPNAKVRTEEFIKTNETTDTTPVDVGVAGAAGNLGARAGSKKKQTLAKNEEIKSSYEIGKTQDMVQQAAGAIKRLTVAAVMDLSDLKERDEQTTVTAAQLEGIIKQAVGFDAARGDEIEVLESKLASTDLVAPLPAAPSPWRGYESLIRNASLGVSALIALVLGILILRKIQPAAPIQYGGLDRRRTRLMATLSDSMREDPGQLRDMMEMWLQSDEEPGSLDGQREASDLNTSGSIDEAAPQLTEAA